MKLKIDGQYLVQILRCQAQLELTLMMCLSDRSTFLALLVTVLHFGALSDRFMFTSTDARATDLRHGFFGGGCCCQGGSVTSFVCVLAAARDVLTQQQ
jgi:hypothetical protein